MHWILLGNENSSQKICHRRNSVFLCVSDFERKLKKIMKSCSSRIFLISNLLMNSNENFHFSIAQLKKLS